MTALPPQATTVGGAATEEWGTYQLDK